MTSAARWPSKCRVAAQRDFRRRWIKRKQPCAAVGRLRRYQHQVGTVGVGRDGLASAELAVDDPHCFPTRILVGEHHDALAGGDPR
jgi:ribosomal protein L20